MATNFSGKSTLIGGKKSFFNPRTILYSNEVSLIIPHFSNQWQSDILYVALQKLSQDKTEHPSLKVSLSEFRKILNVPASRKPRLETAVGQLVTGWGMDSMGALVGVPTEDLLNPLLLYPLFDSFKLSADRDAIIMVLSPTATRLFDHITTNFTKFFLQEAVHLPQYSRNVYRGMMRFINIEPDKYGYRHYINSWDRFINLDLGVPKSYQNNNHYINKRILPQLRASLSPLFSGFDIRVRDKENEVASNGKPIPATVSFSFKEYKGTSIQTLAQRDYGTKKNNQKVEHVGRGIALHANGFSPRKKG